MYFQRYHNRKNIQFVSELDINGSLTGKINLRMFRAIKLSQLFIDRLDFRVKMIKVFFNILFVRKDLLNFHFGESEMQRITNHDNSRK